MSNQYVNKLMLKFLPTYKKIKFSIYTNTQTNQNKIQQWNQKIKTFFNKMHTHTYITTQWITLLITYVWEREREREREILGLTLVVK